VQPGLSFSRYTIEANLVTLDALNAELAEIDENLIRNELTVLVKLLGVFGRRWRRNDFVLRGLFECPLKVANPLAQGFANLRQFPRSKDDETHD
jgi:hypothetical protein